MDGSAVLLQCLDVCPAGDEEGVEEGGARGLKVVGWHDTRVPGGFVFTFGVDGVSAGADDEGKCVGGFERDLEGCHGGFVVAVGD